MGACEKSNLAVRVSRGIPAAPTGWTRITVRQREDGTIEGMAGDEVICRMDRPASDLGGIGFTAGRDGTRFQGAVKTLKAERRDGGIVLPAGHGMAAAWVRASDGFASTWQEVRR